MSETDKNILADLLRERMADGRELVGHYRTAGLMFLGITGTLATLTFKDAANAFRIFEMIGLAITIHFIWITHIEKRVRAPLEADMAALNQSLGSPLLSTRLQVLESLTLAARAVGWITLLGWIVVAIFYKPPGPASAAAATLASPPAQTVSPPPLSPIDD